MFAHQNQISGAPGPVDAGDLAIKEPIGVGGFGQVFRAEWLGDSVAVKFLNAGSGKTQLSDRKIARIKAESELLATKAHQHIVQFYGFCNRHNCIVMQCCANGSLRDLMNCRREHPIIEDLGFRLKCLESVAAAFVFLHHQEPRVVHCDLKPSNVLFDEHYVAKVGDLGLARYVDILDDGLATCYSSSGGILNLLYQAPEVEQASGGRRKGYSPKSDVYSFGVLIQELMTLENPYGIKSLDDFCIIAARQEVRTKGLRPTITDDRSTLPGKWHPCVDPVVELMEDCCRDDPSDRPDFRNIRQRLRCINEEYQRNLRPPRWTVQRTFASFVMFVVCLVIIALVTYLVEAVFKPEENLDPMDCVVLIALTLVTAAGMAAVIAFIAFRIRRSYHNWRDGVGEQDNGHCQESDRTCCRWLMTFAKRPMINRKDAAVIPMHQVVTAKASNPLSPDAALVRYPPPANWPAFRREILSGLNPHSKCPCVNDIRRFCEEHGHERTLNSDSWISVVKLFIQSVEALDTKAWKKYEACHQIELKAIADFQKASDPFAPGPSTPTPIQGLESHDEDGAGCSRLADRTLICHDQVPDLESGLRETPDGLSRSPSTHSVHVPPPSSEGKSPLYF